jgi:Rrf2 family protein
MIELAQRFEQDRPVALREIVTRHEIPQPFLVQILRSLRAAGLVTSTRGSGGGYRLAVDPADISMLNIATAVGCGESATCSTDSMQGGAELEAVRKIWGRADEAAREVLANTYLSDLLTLHGESSSAMFYI